jgi:hypothetical protein
MTPPEQQNGSRAHWYILAAIVLVLGYVAYYKLSERKSLNDAVMACSEIAQTVEEGEICRKPYNEQ